MVRAFVTCPSSDSPPSPFSFCISFASSLALSTSWWSCWAYQALSSLSGGSDSNGSVWLLVGSTDIEDGILQLKVSHSPISVFYIWMRKSWPSVRSSSRRQREGNCPVTFERQKSPEGPSTDLSSFLFSEMMNK